MDITGQMKHNLSADPKSKYKGAHGSMVMYSEIIFIRLQGRRGDTPKDYIGLQGEGSIWFNPSLDKVSK